jgi:cobalt-zinc-cadmium efflux system outer membrane protein
VLARLAVTLILAVLTGCSGDVQEAAVRDFRAAGSMLPGSSSKEMPPAGAPDVGEEPSGPLPLARAVALTLLRSPELAAYSWEVRAAEARELQASLLPNPELEVETEEFGGRGERAGFEGAETSISLSQVIEIAGKRSKRRRLAAAEKRIAQLDYERKRLDVVAEVAETFINLLAAQEHAELADEMVTLSREVLRTAKERVKTGKISPIEATKAEVVLAENIIERAQNRRRLRSLRKALALSWASPAPSFEKAVGDLTALAPIPREETLYALLEVSPDLVRSLAEVEACRGRVALEKANRFGDPAVTAGVSRFNETDDDALSVGLSIPLPLFDRNQGRLREAWACLAKAEREAEAVGLQVRRKLDQAYSELLNANAEAKTLREEVLPGARKVLEGARAGYRTGKFDYLEVLDAQRTFFEVRSRHTDALAGYHRALVEVERLTGVPVSNRPSSGGDAGPVRTESRQEVDRP